MIAVAPLHIARIIIIGAQCGVRVGPSEMFQLTWDDVDFSRSVLHVRGCKKNILAPWREVPIRGDMMQILHTWKNEDEKMGVTHIIHYNGRPLATNIKHAWNSMLEKAGIQRRIRPYDLRHAFATNLIAAGADVGTVAKLMGHSTPQMIFSHYQYVLDEQKKTAIEDLPDILHVLNTMCPKNKDLPRLQ